MKQQSLELQQAYVENMENIYIYSEYVYYKLRHVVD